jgi:endonuclease I
MNGKVVWAWWHRAVRSVTVWAVAVRAVAAMGAGVAFDREGGFTVEKGAEASVTARVVDGGGFGFREWEGNAPGHAEGRRNGTWVIDTSAAGEYWLRAIGWCDGTDAEMRGTIRFRVVEPARAARAAGAGETMVWSEDFSTLDTGGSTALTSWNGWTLTNAFNGTNCFKIGSGKKSGEAISPSVSMGGSAGRAEFSLRAYGSDATTVTLSGSVDGGAWSEWGTYDGLTDPATEYSVDVEACQSVQFKWTGSGKRFHLGPVAVYASGGGGGGTTASNEPPVLDLDPSDTAVALMVGDTYSLAVTATEFEGDEIALSAGGLPAGAVWYADDPKTDSATGLFEWTPGTTGTWTVVFAAADKDGTNTAAVVLTVEPEGAGRLEFDSDEVHVRERSGVAALTVVRTGGAAGVAGVSWETANGTATSGVDYTAGSGTLSFADGETSKTLAVAILDDSAAEENKTFTVSLRNATGGATLGDAAVCTVTIVDDDDANADYYASCYKNGVLKTGDDLKSALHRIVNTSTNGSGIKSNTYSKALTILETIDVPPGESKVRCIYSQAGITSYNREHIWAQSHGIDYKLPGYTDLHHLRLCTESYNSARNDRDFDNCKGVAGASSIGTSANGTCHYTADAFEPPDAAKGDVARACLYMAVRYQGQYGTQVSLELADSVGTSNEGNQLGKLSTLLDWNELDPPDAFETNRNELIYSSYQYNRNPFIDHYKWARAVFDPSNYVPETVTWTIHATVEGGGTVDPQYRIVTNGTSASFGIQPYTWEHYHIGSVSTNGTPIAMGYDPANYLSFTWPNVTDNGTLAVVFDPDLASLGTPIPWLAQYGTNAASVTEEDWDAAELEDWNDDGVPNWQEYLNGTDPTALSLRQVTGVVVTATNNAGFSLAWNAVDYADGYRVRVCSTAVVDAASAGFENGEVDAGWSVSATGTSMPTNAALDGTHGLAFATNGAWLCSPEVANPSSVEFLYKRSGNNDAWKLAVEVSADGGTTWTEAGTVTNATTTAKTGSVDLSAWYGQTVTVRLRDARVSGNAARYVDAVVVKSGGATLAEGTTTATSWTATGLDAGTGYDVYVRGEATTLGTAVGPWSAAVRATTTADASGRKPQNITFPAIADQTVGATVVLVATASSGLEVTYSWSGPATLSGNVLTCTGEGTVTVTASQAGNEEWAPAADVSRSFEVAAAPVELAAPESVWASETNATSFTAAWSEVAGAEGYELSVWTSSGGGDEPGGAETVLWSVDFTNYNGNGNTRLTNDFLAGWTVSNAFIGTNEFRVGASGAGGGVTSAVANVLGTLRVVSGARAWATDSDVVLYVTVGGTTQTNALTGENAVFTNVFEDVDGEVSVGWGTPAGKKRFFLNLLEVTEISAGAAKTADTEPVQGYEARAVAGTSCVVTGLTAATEYGFHVRATAGSATGAWSEPAVVATLAQGGGEGKAQSITFPAIADQTVGATVTLDATASSGLEVTYLWSGPATLSGNVLTCTGEGTVTVTASQAGNEEWAPAADVSRSFEVAAAPVELAAPESVWASETNATSFTAAWSEVAGAEGYELSVWTSSGGGDEPGGAETVLWSVDFTNYKGNGNTRLTNDFLAGWTVTNAFIGTNEFRVGASGAGGGVTSAVANVSGTLRVVSGARAWAADSDVVLYVTAGGTTQTNALTGENAVFTNVFEDVDGDVSVGWGTTAGKKRFFLNLLEVAEISAGAANAADTEPVSGYEARAVAGTSCVVTGLTVATEYGFKVRAVAGGESGAWSADATVATLAAKQSQTITFPEIGTQVATNTVELEATASSGLPVAYVVTDGPAVVDGRTLFFTGAGSVTVTASQTGDANWEAAADVTQTFEVTEPALTPKEAYEAWLAGKGANPGAQNLAFETAETDDADDDGVSNWLEYIADTDPTDDGEFLRLKVELLADGTWLAKPEPASTNRSYSIVTRTDLLDDSTVSANAFRTGSEGIAWTNSMPEGGDVWFGCIRAKLEAEE